jgi:hypothetical protein
MRSRTWTSALITLIAVLTSPWTAIGQSALAGRVVDATGAVPYDISYASRAAC